MKKLLTLSLILGLQANSFAQREIKTYYDPFQMTKIKERYFVDGKNQKQGKYVKYDDRGLKAVEVNFLNDKPNGIGMEYALPLIGFPGDERIKKEANYVNGKLQGKTSYYVYIKDAVQNIKEGKKVLQGEEFYENDKKVREIGYFLNGNKEVDAYLENGVQKKWYDNGQLAIELNVKNGVYDGSWKEWYTNGQIGIVSTRKNGKFFGEKKEYYVDGKLKCFENYAQGDSYGEIFEGIQQYFDSAGILLKELNYLPWENGAQKKQVTMFHSNGVKKSECTEILLNKFSTNRNNNTKIIGDYIEYYSNGKKAVEGKFNDRGYRDGNWKYYEMNTDKIVEGIFFNGNRLGKWKIYFDKNGNEVNTLEEAYFYREITFSNEGKLSNEMVTDFYKNGNKKFEGFLIQIEPDVINGETKFYHENGSLKSQGLMDKNFKKERWVDYFENGNIRLEYELREYYNKEQKIGVWSYFDESQKLEKIEIYRDGNLVETKTGQEMTTTYIEQKKKDLLKLISEQKEEVKKIFTEIIVLGENNIEKTKKKNIYKAYLTLVESYTDKIANISEITTLTEIELKLMKIDKKMFELVNENTEELEKSLKKLSTTSEIERLLNL
jgi:antitoxin component YwqK of YwqJK toxin-antitoxin module